MKPILLFLLLYMLAPLKQDTTSVTESMPVPHCRTEILILPEPAEHKESKSGTVAEENKTSDFLTPVNRNGKFVTNIIVF